MITLELNTIEASTLECLLWQCCTETENGMFRLREELPETAVWRKVAAELGRCTDCGGRGAAAFGAEYCNCEDET
jgi:hypothetical protein